jgi:hypothetical protein
MILSFLTLHSRRFSAYTKRTKRLLTPLAKKVRKFSCMKIPTFIPQQQQRVYKKANKRVNKKVKRES